MIPKQKNSHPPLPSNLFQKRTESRPEALLLLRFTRTTRQLVPRIPGRPSSLLPLRLCDISCNRSSSSLGIQRAFASRNSKSTSSNQVHARRGKRYETKTSRASKKETNHPTHRPWCIPDTLKKHAKTSGGGAKWLVT